MRYLLVYNKIFKLGTIIILEVLKYQMVIRTSTTSKLNIYIIYYIHNIRFKFFFFLI